MAQTTRTPPVMDAVTRSQIMSMIRSHVALAGAVANGGPMADVDVYSKGNSPGPVDQYSKGSPSSILQQVSDPAIDLGAARNVTGSGGGP